LRAVLEETKQGNWANQLNIQINSVAAWNAYTQGDITKGLALMQEAARLESSTFKHPITPGEILPANELLGDMLLDFGDAKAALAAYRVSMDRSPSRFNSLFGAAMAADHAGDSEAAAEYFATIVAMTEGSEVDWPRLTMAREYVAANTD
jgi:tetratricopeptide (TPR) repeat protein